MILRLVYSFFFFSLVTGNQRLEDLTKTTRTGDCQNKICVCQDQPESNTGLPHASPIQAPHRQVVPQITETPLQVAEGHYGYPTQGLINAKPVQSTITESRIESIEREYVPDSHQVPRQVQYEEETEYGEKTICFTPSMVHKMIKAALEYVSHMPSDLNNIISKLDQEDRVSEQGYIEENAIKKPLYPLDSKTIFQMLDKPKSESRTNLILKYELPSHKEPRCREALEKLIELAYTAYMELEAHPQCREYLYNFADHQPEDRPTGHLDRPPLDMKSLIASILHQVDKRKPILDVAMENNRYGDMEIPDHGLPKPLLHNIPQIHEYNIPKKPQIVEYSVPDVSEYNVPPVNDYNVNEYHVPDAHELIKPALNLPKIHTENHDFIVPKVHDFSLIEKQEYNLPKVQEYTITESHEYNVPKMQEYTITQNHEYNVPKVQEYTITQENHEYNVPKVHDFSITENHEYNVPKVQEFTITQSHEHNVPKVHEYTITQENHEFNIPQIHDFTITKSQEYNVPKVHEYSVTHSHEFNIPQIHDLIIPPVQSIEMPEIHETIHETVEEIIPLQPEETINILINLLQNSDHPSSGNLLDRLMNIVLENQNNFHPRILKLLFALLNGQKQNNIHRFKDILLIILDFEKNQDWPINDRLSENMLSYLTPDHTGKLDSRIVEIILDLYNKPVKNEKHIEYILSLLRPFKEGNLKTRIGDLILKLIHLHQHNLLLPDHVETLLKLLKNGNGHPIEVDVTDLLSRWNEIGLSPNQVDKLFGLLKPYAYGHPDHRTIDIIYYLLTKNKHLSPNNLDFILSFLFPENGVLDTRRIDIIHFLLKNMVKYPKLTHILLTLLQENAPGVLNSRFLEILLFLDSHKFLTHEILETIVDLLKNEINGQLDENQVKTLFFQLAPVEQSNPKFVVDVLNLLNLGGMYNNIVEWFESTNSQLGVPNRDSNPPKLKVISKEVRQEKTNEYRTPNGGYQTLTIGQQMPDHDFMSIFKWLESQGLITPDQGSNTDLVHKIMKILEVGERELGVVELTYMLKHEKPLIYQPVYYVKYRLPILSFISNMKNLLLENPNLNADPMKLLQELIVVSNVTEVSPNLQGYPKEEILKLTFNDGDLVQAKILDEQNLSLNDQISYVHGLNSDISPEEILQLNKMNEAKYFPDLKEIKGVHPDQLTIKEVDKFIDVPAIHYRHVEMNPTLVGNSYKKKTIHKTFISREVQDQNALHNNAQFMPQN